MQPRPEQVSKNTNPGRQVVMANKFRIVVPNTCGPSVGNVLHVTLLASKILRWRLDFWKICAPLLITIFTGS
jgi:hypothetical protein